MTSAAPLLVARDVVAGYVRGLPIVQGASVQVNAGEVVTIIGPNGAGKSTLLKGIVGLIGIESGSVRLDAPAGARELAGLPAPDVIAAGVGYVPQTANVFGTLTIGDNLLAGAHLLAGRSERARRVERAFGLFPALAAKRGDKARTLSGGQRQMLAVARALMTDPRVLLLDEPTAGLAPKVVAEVFERLRALAQGGVAVLLVEQNAKAALRMSDRGYVLAQGRNHTEGPAAALLADPAVAAAFLGGEPAPAGGADGATGAGAAGGDGAGRSPRTAGVG